MVALEQRQALNQLIGQDMLVNGPQGDRALPPGRLPIGWQNANCEPEDHDDAGA